MLNTKVFKNFTEHGSHVDPWMWLNIILAMAETQLKIFSNCWELNHIEDNANGLTSDFEMGRYGDIGIVVGRGPGISGETYPTSMLLCSMWVTSLEI